jgi:hypothetical protein
MAEPDDTQESRDANEPVARHGSGRMNPSEHFAEDLRRDAVAAFGSNGAWLLLSIVWYGWRSYYDLAVAHRSRRRLPGSPRSARPGPRVLRDRAAGNPLTAAKAHPSGSDAFFSTYTSPGLSIGELVRGIQDITVEELELLAGVPTSVDDIPRPSAAGEVGLLDPAAMATVEVSGLHIPQRAIDDGARQIAFDDARGHAEGFCVTIRQLAGLIDRPPGSATAPRTQPLREVDDAFRHGHRVFFYDAVPEERGFNFLGDPTALEHPAVDLFMPRNRDKDIHWATVGCSPERTASSPKVDVTRQRRVSAGYLAFRPLFGVISCTLR